MRRPDHAESGLDALEAALTGSFDLMLLDVNMPEMDGWEVLRLLKSDERFAAPIVMFTVKTEVRDKVHALQDGALDYIARSPSPTTSCSAGIGRIFEGRRVRP